jgi:hypothetical protein
MITPGFPVSVRGYSDGDVTTIAATSTLALVDSV